MIGEQRDFAVAFVKGVKEGQESGLNNRKLLTNDKLCDYLNIKNFSSITQLPHNVLSVLKEYNVYIRKLRGRNLWGVWWLPAGEISHGRYKSR